MASSRLVAKIDADTLLASVISVQRVSWYFWGQNRLGNLLPLLASPVSDVYANLYVQLFLRCLAGALSPLFVVLLLRSRLDTAVAFAVTLTASFVLIPARVMALVWIDNTPYAVPIALLGLALLIQRQASPGWLIRTFVVFALVLVATWVDIAIVLITVPVFALFAISERNGDYAALLVISTVCYVIVSRHAEQLPNPPPYTAMTVSLAAMQDLLITLRTCMPDGSAVAAGLGLVFAAAVARARAPTLLPMVRSAVLLIAGCAFAVLVTGTLVWFAINGHAPRYVCLPVILAASGVGLLVVETAAGLVRPVVVGPRFATALAAGVALATVAVAARPTLAVSFSAPAAVALADRAVREHARYIAGDYRAAWPAVFEVLHRLGPDAVYGLSHRAEDVRDRINAAAVDGATIVCADADENVCRRVFHDAANRNEIRGRPLDEALKVVDRGSYGPDNKPLTVLRIDAP
jgi:hypothetical protein